MFTAPTPFKEALDAHAVKSVLATSGNTAQLQQLSGAIKRRALFSATVASTELLQKISDSVDAILAGQMDQASLRAEIKLLLADVGYQPDPEQIGGLQDLSSTARIDLQLETNVDTARGYGWFMQGQQADVLDEWPAQELVRDFATRHPRGEGTSLGWPERWQRAGGEFYDGRMVALKDDPVWSKLGDPDLFDDGLGNPYPPFAFNSGMGVRDVGRDEAEQLGIIEPNQEVAPQDLSFNSDLQASPDVRDDLLKSLLNSSGLGSFNSDGVFEFTDAGGDS